MIRRQITVLFCIGIGIFSLVRPILAATPTPTPASNAVATNAASPTPTPIIIHNGLINEKIDNTQDAEAQPIPRTPSGVPTPPPQYKVTVPPVVDVNTANFNIPKLDEVADWLTNVTRFMSAKQIKDNVTHHQNNLYISGQARRCITVAGFVIPDLPDQIGDKYKTGLVEYLPKLITATGLLSAQTVRNTVSLTDGKYNFEGPSYEVDGPPPCDTAGGVGTPQEPKQIVLVQGQGFNFIQWALSQIQKFTVKTVFISKQLCPECERIHCLLTGCVKGNVDLAYIKDDNKQQIIKQSGGIADAFRTVNMDTTKGESPHGQEENFTKTNTSYTKQMENSADLIKCSLVPPAQRAKLGLDGKCSGFVKEIVPKENCEEALKNISLDPSKYSQFGSGNDAPLGFSIPMHNTSCTISNLEAVAAFARQWANKQEGYDNVMKYYKTIEEYAVQAGWNPSFLVALWIEETAAGSVGNFEMGCTYDFGKSGPADPTVCGQLSCIFNYPVRNSTYDFLCSYGSNGEGCTSFLVGTDDNRCFPSNLRGAYQEVVARGAVGSGCAPVGTTSELFRKDCESKVPGGSIFDK